MIPKGGCTNFRGIGLLEVLWKVISIIINLWLLSSIHFHDVLHGFCTGRGTGTTTLKENLLQQLIATRETSLHNLRKSYDSLDREHFLYILAGNGVGPRTTRILKMYWDWLQM